MLCVRVASRNVVVLRNVYDRSSVSPRKQTTTCMLIFLEFDLSDLEDRIGCDELRMVQNPSLMLSGQLTSGLLMMEATRLWGQ